MVDERYLMQGLMQRGLPEHIAQGFVMNMRDESGLNPGINEINPIVPGSRGGFGLYQLTGPRRRAYEQFAQSRGVDVADPDAQLDFLMIELQGPESRAAQSIFAAQNPQDAAVAIARDFLRPAPENLQKRVQRYTGGNMAPQTGLLGNATISTQGQMPQQEPEQLPFFQRPGVANFFDTLAMGLEGMTLNPNEGLMRAAQARMQQRREAAQTAQQRNRTVEALKQMGADPQLIQLAQSGYGEAALKEALRLRQGAEPTKGVEIGDRLVNPITGEVIADFTGDKPAYKPEDIAKARKEFTSLKPVKDFADQTAAYGRIMSSIERDPGQKSPAADLALIFNYMKVLDPGSTVREGEFATAAKAGSFGTQIQALVTQIESGELLTPSQRADFADRATRLYQGAERQYQNLVQQYGSFAERAGLPVEQVIPDFGFGGDLYQRPLEFQLPPTPPNTDPQEWADAWAEMTDEQRRIFLEGGQ